MTTAPLGEICDVQIGRTPSRDTPKYWGGRHLWASIADLNAPVIRSTREHISDEAVAAIGRSPISPGTLLLSFKLSLGRVAVAGVPLYTNEAIAALPIAKPTEVDSQFLYYYLQTVDWPALGRRAAKGNCLNKEILEELPISFPAVSEQQHVFRLLEKADRLRRMRSYAVKLGDTLIQSIFLQMFGEAQSVTWPLETVEDLAADIPNAIRTGPFGSQLLHSEFVSAGIAVLGIDNVVQNRFSWDQRRFISEEKYKALQRYTVHPGDVLISIMATCGRCAVVPDDIPVAINTKHLCGITLDKKRCLPQYLHACFLNHPAVLRRLGVGERGAIMPGLNMQIIKELPIPLPPMPLQEKFVALTERLEVQRRQHAEAERQAEHLFQTLLHQAFSPVALT